MSALLLALGCGGPAESPPEALEVEAWLAAPPTCSGGTLVVQATYDRDAIVVLTEPEIPGLELARLGEPSTEALGDRAVTTWRVRFTGGKGAYELTGFDVGVTHGDDELHGMPGPVWADLCVEAPRGELADIVEPPGVLRIPWGGILGVGGVALLMAGGLWVAFRRVPSSVEAAAPEEAPDVRALREWDRIRRDPTISDLERAQGISRIFRTYAEEVLGFPATAWTTTEVVEHLGGLAHLPEGNVPRARRLLRATDRVKFAEATPGVDLFEELDADLRAFVGSTRPRTWAAS